MPGQQIVLRIALDKKLYCESSGWWSGRVMTGQKMTFLGNVFHVVMTACQYKLLFYLLKHFLQAEISAERPWSMWMCHPFIVNSHFVERKVLVCSCGTCSNDRGGDLWVGKVIPSLPWLSDYKTTTGLLKYGPWASWLSDFKNVFWYSMTMGTLRCAF